MILPSSGIPDRADLAETYYSQFDEDFENGDRSDGDDDDDDGDDDDGEGTLVAMEGTKDSEFEDLIHFMETALDKGDTSKEQNI